MVAAALASLAVNPQSELFRSFIMSVLLAGTF